MSKSVVQMLLDYQDIWCCDHFSRKLVPVLDHQWRIFHNIQLTPKNTLQVTPLLQYAFHNAIAHAENRCSLNCSMHRLSLPWTHTMQLNTFGLQHLLWLGLPMLHGIKDRENSVIYLFLLITNSCETKSIIPQHIVQFLNPFLTYVVS